MDHLDIPDDAYKPIKELVEDDGFIFEEHIVTTNDGFINTIHRIYKDTPYKNDCDNPEILKCEQHPKPIIIFQHGYADASDAWVVNSIEKSPAYYAATEGYDIWMTNSRGNVHSMNHTTLDPERDSEYWMSTFTDWSREDIPAVFKHIRNVTKLPPS